VINDIGTNLSSFLITTVANRNYVGPSNMDGFPGKSRHFIGHWDSHPQIRKNGELGPIDEELLPPISKVE